MVNPGVVVKGRNGSDDKAKLTAISMAKASFRVGPIPSLMTSLTVRWATLNRPQGLV